MAGRGGVAAMLCALALAGCASITEGNTQAVLVSTVPLSGASCSLQNEKGSWQIPSTPATTTITKARGALTVNCTHPDGAKGVSMVSSSTSAALYGNALVGGLIGAAVDINSGAAYYYPDQVTVALASPAPATTGGATTAPAAPPASSAPASLAAAPPPTPTPIRTGAAPPLSSAPGQGPVAAAAGAATPVSPSALRAATEYCSKADQDPRLDPLRDVIALDKPPSLAMQTSTAHLTAAQKQALDAWQPLYAACRDKLMATSPEIARIFDKDGVRNRDFLNLYENRTTVGDFNRARARDFENLRIAAAELTPPPAVAAAPTPATVEPAVAYPKAGQPAGAENRPVDYCPGMNELVCVNHQHHI